MLCPIPSIVSEPGELFAMAGSVLLSVIVPLTLKLIVLSVPAPITQSPPVVSTPGLLALLIASRRLQNPSPEGLESLRVFTAVGEIWYSYAPMSQAEYPGESRG